MFPENFEQIAMRGEPLPDGLTQSESLYFLSLRNLYALYKSGQISKDNASAEKRMLVKTFDEARKQEDLTRRMAERWVSITQPANEFALNPCMETAEAFYRAVYNLPENWRAEARAI